MTATIIATCEQLSDQACELGLLAQRAAGSGQTMPAETLCHLREALRALARARVAFERTQATNEPTSVSHP